VTEDRLYFRQWLAGRDFAAGDPLARQMVNFVYAIGDSSSGEAVLVDPAYAPGELVEMLAEDSMELVGALATHYHPDHVGGSMMGASISGIVELLEVASVPIHVQRDESRWVERATGVEAAELVAHDSADVVRVGDVEITLIHTPGHTPGSQCFLVDGRLVSGDTLFLEGCGRTDLPGSDPLEMYRSLTERLSRVPDETVLYPGHLYSPERSAPMGEVRRDNYALAPVGEERWLAMFAR
jgi:glyoxylase-like metal-dependent hydrolase (beta-lactamase superfamily II)